MTVCLDTSVFLQIFGRKQPFYPILRALLDGRLALALSTEIFCRAEHKMDDDSASAQCRAGDIDAFRHLVERYQTEAFGHALAILGSRADAADAVQDAFIKSFRALDGFQAGRRF